MLTPETIKRRLQDSNLKRVAESAGVHYNALYRLMSNDTGRPSYELIRKLSLYLETLEAEE